MYDIFQGKSRLFAPNSKWRTTYTPHCEVAGRFPGVYVIYVADELVYVGQSRNIHSRVLMHDFKRVGQYFMRHKVWGRVALARVTYKIKQTSTADERFDLEARLIARLRPRYNKTGYPGARSKSTRGRK